VTGRVGGLQCKRHQLFSREVPYADPVGHVDQPEDGFAFPRDESGRLRSLQSSVPEFRPSQMEISQIPDGDKFKSDGLFRHHVFFASEYSQHIRPPLPLAREKSVKRVVACRRSSLIFGCRAGHNLMRNQVIEVGLFGAWLVSSALRSFSPAKLRARPGFRRSEAVCWIA
jgi:hypothetical protein